MECIRYVGDEEKIVEKVGFCTGSGMSFASNQLFEDVDVYLTGDLKYHDAMWVHEEGYAIVDITHFYSEKFSTQVLYNMVLKVLESDIMVTKDEAIINQYKQRGVVMSDMIKVTIMGESCEVESGLDLLSVAKDYQERFDTPIVLAIVDGKLSELRNNVKENTNIEFLDMLNKDGIRTYQRSLSFVLIKAAHDVLGHEAHVKVIVQYSINNGFYCEISPRELLTKESMALIKSRMLEMIDQKNGF